MSTFTSEIDLTALDFATPAQPQLVGTFISAGITDLTLEGGYVTPITTQPQVRGYFVSSAASLSAVDAAPSARGTYIS